MREPAVVSLLKPESVTHQASSTYPAKRHHVESVGATVELIEEVTVGVLRGVIHLQLAAWSPVDEMQKYR